MTRVLAYASGLAFAASLALASMAAGETYKATPNTNCLTPTNCIVVGVSIKGWKCHWSMDIKGTELKSLPIAGQSQGDATNCAVNECVAACSATSTCIAIDVVKSAAQGSVCMCTLFSSVSSATVFEEIRTPSSATLSGWACIRLPKHQPPITENPDFPRSGRPGFEQDRLRPDTPGTGTPGRGRP